MNTENLHALIQQYTKLKSATVVDHIIPLRGDPVLFWDRNNW